MILDFEPGDKVINPDNNEWGIGQVQSIINEKITIGVAAYGNVEASKICLNKIFESIKDNFELILVDDCSPDKNKTKNLSYHKRCFLTTYRP